MKIGSILIPQRYKIHLKLIHMVYYMYFFIFATLKLNLLGSMFFLDFSNILSDL